MKRTRDLIPAFFAALIFILTGCGKGAVIGTGGPRFEGIISDESHQGLQGLLVRLAEIDETATTNRTGSFVIQSPFGIDTATLLILIPGVRETEIRLDPLPEDASLVRLALIRRQPSFEVVVAGVEYFRDDGSRIGG